MRALLALAAALSLAPNHLVYVPDIPSAPVRDWKHDPERLRRAIEKRERKAKKRLMYSPGAYL